MIRTRTIALLLAPLVFVAAACGGDDPIDAGSSTTVPLSDATTTAAPADPDSSVALEPETTNPATTGPPAPGPDLEAVDVALEPIGTYVEPIDTVAAPNGEFWLFERAGTATVLDPVTGAIGDTVLDLSAETVAEGERGLLGAAADDTHLFVNFTDLDGTTQVDAFLLDDEGRPSERHTLLTITQPFPNHNGGGLVVGPDGRLYIGVGDGGAAADPLAAGQDPTQILGSILRIDPTPGESEPYAIPTDNPYADGVDGRPEIFMIGARNPWRISFDTATGDFWVADVGQNEWEEVNVMRAVDGAGLGGNLGWNLREGTREFTGDRPVGNIDPVFEYPNGEGDPGGCSVSGGQVYRGDAIPELVGAYVFGDFCASTIWAIAIVDGAVQFRDLDASVDQLVAITSDADGELLTLSLGGDLSRVVPQ